MGISDTTASARELVASEAGVGPVVLVARVVDLGLGLLEKVLGQVGVIGDMGSASRVVRAAASA